MGENTLYLVGEARRYIRSPQRKLWVTFTTECQAPEERHKITVQRSMPPAFAGSSHVDFVIPQLALWAIDINAR